MARPDTTKVIIVGIERYEAGSQWNLNGPARDAIRFLDFVRGRGVPRENIGCFVSPLPDNEETIRQASEGAGMSGAPTQAALNDLLEAGIQSEAWDLLLLYWSGHGYMTVEGERRLFTADATRPAKRNVDLNSLLASLRSDAYPRIARFDGLIDACSEYFARDNRGITHYRFAAGQGVAGREQRVLCAAAAGELARNLGAEQTGLFTRELLAALDAHPADQWPIDFERLAATLGRRFDDLNDAREADQRPSLIWIGERQVFSPGPLPSQDRRDLFFCHLGVFHDSFSFLACAEMARGRFSVCEIDTYLRRLVAASVIARHPVLPSRYLFSAIAAEAAPTRLAMSDWAEELGRRHAEYYCAIAEAHESRLMSPGRGRSLSILEADRRNVLAAIQWCGAHPELVERGLAAAGAMYWFWNLTGRFAEGRECLSAILQADGVRVGSFGYAKALYARGCIAFMEGDIEQARDYLGMADEAWRGQAADPARDRWLGYTLVVLGRVQQDFQLGRKLEERAVALFRQHGDDWGLALALNDLGYVLGTLGAGSEAADAYAASISLWRKLHDTWGLPLALNNLGLERAKQKRLDEAKEAHEEALGYQLDEGDEWGAAESLKYLGEVAARKRDYAEAEASFRDSLRRLRAPGRKQLVTDCLLGLANVTFSAAPSEASAAAATRMLAVWSAENERQKYICTSEHKALAASLEDALRTELGPVRFSEEWEAARRLEPFELIDSGGGCSGSK